MTERHRGTKAQGHKVREKSFFDRITGLQDLLDFKSEEQELSADFADDTD